MKPQFTVYSSADDICKVIGDFLDFCRTKNLSHHTEDYYTYRLQHFAKYCEERLSIVDPSAVTPAHIRSFITYMMDSGYATKTINHSIQSLKAFFGFLFDEERITSSPAERIKSQRLERKIIPTFSAAQVQAMLNVCDRTTFLGLRDHTMLLTMFDTGLRVDKPGDLGYNSCIIDGVQHHG